jgi:4-hydroxy-tetrahydrodipicolinate reductase
MRIALIGYGRMGHEIEEAAVGRGHSVGLVIDVENQGDFIPAKFNGIDVAIEFTLPDSAFGNISRCLEMRIPVVSGTTGWAGRYTEAAELCRQYGTSFIWSSNFSIGVNILFRINAELSRLMSSHNSYNPSIVEIHHTRKLDAPSGTAITLAEGIGENNSNFSGWCAEDAISAGKVPIRSVREGDVPGTHVIDWKSDIDGISLRHEAKNRKGLALGAVVAAEYIYNRKGVFTMSDVLGF